TKNNLTKKPANDKLKDLIKIIMKKNVVIDAVTSYDNHCITYLMDDMDGDVPTMTTFMVILFIALAFVSAVQIKSMIEKESSVI
ncbi:ABC transporter permease, partial [Lactobacillus paracasei]